MAAPTRPPERKKWVGGPYPARRVGADSLEAPGVLGSGNLARGGIWRPEKKGAAGPRPTRSDPSRG